MNLSGTVTLNKSTAKHAKGWFEVTPSIAQGIAPFVLGKGAQELTAAVELSKKGKGENPDRIDAANQMI
jgi:hypothetical protein